jgi:hypothetical protein
MTYRNVTRSKWWRLAARRWHPLSVALADSRGERLAATMMVAQLIAVPSIIGTVMLCVVYAFEMSRPLVVLAALPHTVTLVLAMVVFPGSRFTLARYVNAEPALLVSSYLVGLTVSWFFLFAVLSDLPLGREMAGLTVLILGVLCMGGLVFAQVPICGFVFMSALGVRLSMTLTPLVDNPPFYDVLIVTAVLTVTAINFGQAISYARRLSSERELRALECNRAEQDRQRAVAERQRVEERHAAEVEHQRRLEADRAQERAARRQAMADHARRFDDSVLAVVSRMDDIVADLGGSTERLSEIGTKSYGHVDAVGQRARVVGTSMRSAADASARMRSAIDGVVREIAAQVEATRAAEARSTAARQSARALADSGAQVRGITGEIERIAGMTNRLALNALIEAARSGEAGRAFAVVASEVKGLAAETGGAASRIADHIAEMDRRTADVTAAVDAIVDQVARIAAGASDIARQIDEQRHAADGIVGDVERARDGTNTVEKALTALHQDAGVATRLAEEMARIAATVTDHSRALGAASSAFGATLRA